MGFFNKYLIATGRLAMMECALLLGLWICASDPADAQWQTSTHSVPVGKGADVTGVTGFNSVGPCAVGIPIVGGASGVTSDPACGIAGLAGGGLGGSQAGATIGQVPVFPGSSGPAVPRTPASGINVLADTAVTCNGTADDTTGMVAVLAAASGLKAYTPPSVTCQATALSFPANTEFEISGRGTLKKYGVGSGILAEIGGNYVSLFGKGSLESNNTPIFSDGKSYLNVDGLTLKSSAFYGAHLQNNNHATLKNLHIVNVAQYSIFAQSVAAYTYNLGIFDNLVDHTNVPFDAIGLSATSDVYNSFNTVVSRNRMLGNAATTSQGIFTFPSVPLQTDRFRTLIIAENAIKDFTFGISSVGAGGAAIGLNSITGATEIGLEIVNDTNSAAVGNAINAGIFGLSLNKANGTAAVGNAIRYTTSFGIDIYDASSAGVAVVGNTVVPVSGIGIRSAGSNLAFVGNNLNGVIGATTGFSFTGGSNRVVVGNIITDFITAISGLDPTTDTVVGNNVLGAILHGSYSGYSGTEIMLADAGATHAITTIATGSPLLAYHHRGATNTGTWEWANGTNGGSAQMRLGATGIITLATWNGAPVQPTYGGTGITALGTGVATALGINVGSAGAFVTFNGAIGTPSGGTVTNLTGTASININGTVGATTPTTGSFTTIAASGLVLLSANATSFTNMLSILNSHATGIPYFFIGKVNSAQNSMALGWDNTNQVGGFWINGAAFGSSMAFEKTGKVGFGGNTTPATTVDITGSLTVSVDIFAPNLPTTTAALAAALCWTATTGQFQRDTNAGGCLVSAREAKNILGTLPAKQALDIVMRLKPEVFRYKVGAGDEGKFEQIGFVADEVALADERLAIRNDNGIYSGVRYMQITAALAGAVQHLKADNDNLRIEVEQIKKRVSR